MSSYGSTAVLSGIVSGYILEPAMTWLAHQWPCHHFVWVTYFQSLVGADLGLSPGEVPPFYQWWLHVVCAFVRPAWLPHSKWCQVVSAWHIEQHRARWPPQPTVWWGWHYPWAIAWGMKAQGLSRVTGTFYVCSVTCSSLHYLFDWMCCSSRSWTNHSRQTASRIEAWRLCCLLLVKCFSAIYKNLHCVDVVCSQAVVWLLGDMQTHWESILALRLQVPLQYQLVSWKEEEWCWHKLVPFHACSSDWWLHVVQGCVLCSLSPF